MEIHREREGDAAAIFDVHARAFPTAVEARLVDELRASADWLPDLSLVAWEGQDPIGHVVCTRAFIDPLDVPVLGLGPIGVLPHHQGRGVGSALMHAVLAAAEDRGVAVVGLLGEPGFYGRFGFVVSTAHGIQPPDATWGRYFQVRVFGTRPPNALDGTFRYAEPFSRL